MNKIENTNKITFEDILKIGKIDQETILAAIKIGVDNNVLQQLVDEYNSEKVILENDEGWFDFKKATLLKTHDGGFGIKHELYLSETKKLVTKFPTTESSDNRTGCCGFNVIYKYRVTNNDDLELFKNTPEELNKPYYKFPIDKKL